MIKVFDEGEEIVDLELLHLEHHIRVTCKGRYLKIVRNTLTCIPAGLVQRKVPEKTTAIPNNIVKQSSDVDKENNLEVNLRNKEETTPQNFFTKDNYENSLILGLATLVILAVTVVVVVKTTGRRVEIGHVERNQIYGVYYYPDGSRRQNVQEVVDHNDEYNMNTRQPHSLIGTHSTAKVKTISLRLMEIMPGCRIKNAHKKSFSSYFLSCLLQL